MLIKGNFTLLASNNVLYPIVNRDITPRVDKNGSVTYIIIKVIDNYNLNLQDVNS